MAIPFTFPPGQTERYAASRDEAGFYEAAPFYSCRLVLAADISKSIAVPAGAVRVKFGGTDIYHVRPNAAVPALSGDVTDGTAGFVNLARMSLLSAGADGAVTTIYLRAPYADTTVSIAFYGA
jgi:hypothetical protein